MKWLIYFQNACWNYWKTIPRDCMSRVTKVKVCQYAWKDNVFGNWLWTVLKKKKKSLLESPKSWFILLSWIFSKNHSIHFQKFIYLFFLKEWKYLKVGRVKIIKEEKSAREALQIKWRLPRLQTRRREAANKRYVQTTYSKPLSLSLCLQ